MNEFWNKDRAVNTIHQQQDEIRQLREQLQWRTDSPPPRKDVLCKLADGTHVVAFWSDEWYVWSNDPYVTDYIELRNAVEKWMEIPE